MKGVNFSSGSTRCGVPAIASYKCVCPKVNKKSVEKNTMCAFFFVSVGIMTRRIKSRSVLPLVIPVFMMMAKVAWWLMEWVCRRLWALYPTNMTFLYYPHVDPVEVAMVLNPSRQPHWGRFVTYSMWLQGVRPSTDRSRQGL